MAHTEYDRALRVRLHEIDEQLRPMEALIEERSHITRILRLRGDTPQPGTMMAERPNGLVGVAPPRPVPNVAERRERPIQSTFLVDPNSKTSKILKEARKILEQASDRQTTFLTIYHSLPKDLLGQGRHAREHVRGTLQRAGHRQGIDYVNSDLVRLTV